ncbi:HCP-like protein [Hypoxylon trugodes]|uniref:HCP-like protein n=1 Tax=Hypoxylon trugodes TaxID=326681 RepID=UPI00218FE0F8|nr:HCP-like protein [Hypoxylon trugodes]KAI1386206.1 HCP-like protein [Hypoxylon trugodes]
MGLRDLIKKKDHLDGGVDRETLDRLAGPEFTFIRSDTHTQEIIHPPSNYNNDHQYLTAKDAAGSSSSSSSRARRSLDVFRPRSRGSSTSSVQSGLDAKDKEHSVHRRLSQRLHLSKAPSTSDFVPEDLPQINVLSVEDGGGKVERGGGGADKDAYERQWEKRATILAEANERGQRTRSPSVAGEQVQVQVQVPELRLSGDGRYGAPGGNGNGAKKTDGVVSSKVIDEQIQEAIRLHEEGQLDQSTVLFGRLADPRGANNPLSQVLYGLALRHGWGCEPDPERAVTYLSAAASNAAAVESMALQAGLQKGGAAKGELVLAIFELANCFRHGWGIPRDPVAAKQYYETAANLGDTDAMNEVGWCYLEGFGCKKDKVRRARSRKAHASSDFFFLSLRYLNPIDLFPLILNLSHITSKSGASRPCPKLNNTYTHIPTHTYTGTRATAS